MSTILKCPLCGAYFHPRVNETTGEIDLWCLLCMARQRKAEVA